MHIYLKSIIAIGGFFLCSACSTVLGHNGSDLDYGCHKYDSNTTFHCHDSEDITAQQKELCNRVPTTDNDKCTEGYHTDNELETESFDPEEVMCYIRVCGMEVDDIDTHYYLPNIYTGSRTEYEPICAIEEYIDILDMYYQYESCEIFATYCKNRKICEYFEEDIAFMFDETILSNTSDVQECHKEYHVNEIRITRCRYLHLQKDTPPSEQVTNETPMEAVVTPMTPADPAPTSDVVPPQVTIPAVVQTTPSLSDTMKQKIQGVKLLLDQELKKMNVGPEVLIGLLQNIKGNLIVNSEKYLIAEYLISLYQ